MITIAISISSFCPSVSPAYICPSDFLMNFFVMNVLYEYEGNKIGN